jgi:hypothetical protein
MCAVPTRSKCARKKIFLFVLLKFLFLKWKLILTILSNPRKFKRYWLRKMALGTKGLITYFFSFLEVFHASTRQMISLG